ncbi:HNH endonuclease signature motif containing protein [Microbacterium sp. CIAB417]|uniref:HNH endonuclease signature motif containing protein n=1 Tax=Microbacterium sp. CIAB417 TaxID=2860287 RepID=UPI001FAB618F|nr:HNH endonuclease signature motif containing protein [Microbacterium sp. CIAB417]
MIDFSDADAAALAEAVDTVRKADVDIAAAQARRMKALADAEHLARRLASGSRANVRVHDMAQRAVASEIAAATRLADRTVQRQMSAAAELVDDYPLTHAALAAGRIQLSHARVIVDAGANLPHHRRAAFERGALTICETETVGRARSRVEILAERQHPTTLTERHATAREGRRVFTTPLPHGMSEVVSIQPAVIADAIHDRLTRQAQALIDLRRQAADRANAARRAGDEPDGGDLLFASDTRTTDQIRADLLADMLLTTQPGADPTRDDDGPGTLGAIRAHVQVVVPVGTLTGRDAQVGELVGRGPIDAETARVLAGESCTGWDRILTDAASGQVVSVDRRSVPPALRRTVHARDRHCRFPGCRVPAIRCEIDHVRDWVRGGPTHLDNLQCLCQRHHSMKQFTAWRVRQLPGGVIEWTSPLGATYIDDPPPPAQFIESPEDPAHDAAEQAPF